MPHAVGQTIDQGRRRRGDAGGPDHGLRGRMLSGLARAGRPAPCRAGYKRVIAPGLSETRSGGSPLIQISK